MNATVPTSTPGEINDDKRRQ